MKLVILGEFPTLNEYIAAERGDAGRYKAAKIKKAYTRLAEIVAGIGSHLVLDAECRWGGHAPLPLEGPARMQCTWFRCNRRTDPDNVAFAVKFLLDGLVQAGILRDDSWRYVAGIEHRFAVDRDNPRVEVELEEVG